MILQKVPYTLNADESKQLHELSKKISDNQALKKEKKITYESLWNRVLEYKNRQYQYILMVYKNKKELILKDCHELLSAVTKKDFQEYINHPEMAERKKNLTDFENCYYFLEKLIFLQRFAYHCYSLDQQELYNMIENKAKQWYDKPENFSIKKQNYSHKDFAENLENNRYFYHLQNKETNALGHTSSKSFYSINYQTNSIIHDDVEIKILRPTVFVNTKWNVNTHKVWELSLHKLVDVLPRGKAATVEMIDRQRTIKITVKEFAKKCNIPERFARDYLNEAGKALYEMSVRCEVDEPEQPIKRGRKKNNSEQTKKYKLHRVVAAITEDQNGYSVINGVLELTFDIDFAKYLSQHSRALPRHENIFRINSNNNRHSYYIANKLQEHYFMNIGKANANRISVRCLKEELPDLPTYDEVMNADGDRHIEKRIIRPFERDMNALVDEYDILETWHYCTKNGEMLTDEQLQNYDYSDWNEWLIEFYLKEYPQQTEMLRLAEHSEKKKNVSKSKKTKN